MTGRRLLRLIALGLGLALLVWQVRAVGWDDIGRGLRSVGWWGAIGILALSLLRMQSRAAAWSGLLVGDVPPGRALAAVLAGDAAGNLTPLGPFVGEPTKAAYLAGVAGTGKALAALTAETFFFGVSVALYTIAGTAALIYTFPVDDTLRQGAAIALGAMAVVLIVASWLAWQRPAVAGALLSRLPLVRSTTLADRLRAFERTVYGSVGHARARLGVVFASEAIFHVLSFLEAWLTIWLLTGASHPIAAFVLDTVGRLTNVFFKVVPLQLGVLQVGSELVARAIGLPPGTGVTMSLVRTARVLVWTSVGLGLLGRRGMKT